MDALTTASKLTEALAPAFAVGFAIQHLNELLDPILSAWARNDNNRKKTLMGLASLVFGGLATYLLDLRILALISGEKGSALYQFMDGVVTALVISTGTEGINSIVKFLGYSKDQTKGKAATSEQAAGADLKKVNREP